MRIGFTVFAVVSTACIHGVERRWNCTTPQWPIMHAVLLGVTRNQMMARHKANHYQSGWIALIWLID